MYRHKRVLVALDGSTSSEAVLRLLLEIAGPLDMTVLLMRALEPVPPVVVEAIAAALRAKGIDVSWQVRLGRPAEEILAAARESSVDLIAMATHGRTGLGRLLFGSVAEAVLRHAPVPVFMIRQPHAVETASATKEESAR
jgi:nucleotide-binding universal stress UspA family protein